METSDILPPNLRIVSNRHRRRRANCHRRCANRHRRRRTEIAIIVAVPTAIAAAAPTVIVAAPTANVVAVPTVITTPSCCTLTYVLLWLKVLVGAAMFSYCSLK
ncbi:hypothetical protein KSP39_PZI015245 [Platanthera zijinensis]|uniref:Uncharacterized protein n=1 Tax=Platanthera zijinensis TaxID=2320716 RepID=A0AAP0B9R6_9ASPA